MTKENVQRLSDEISAAINTCTTCPLFHKECEDSEYGTCGGVWYEHIYKLEGKSFN